MKNVLVGLEHRGKRKCGSNEIEKINWNQILKDHVKHVKGF